MKSVSRGLDGSKDTKKMVLMQFGIQNCFSLRNFASYFRELCGFAPVYRKGRKDSQRTAKQTAVDKKDASVA